MGNEIFCIICAYETVGVLFIVEYMMNIEKVEVAEAPVIRGSVPLVRERERNNLSHRKVNTRNQKTHTAQIQTNAATVTRKHK